MKAIQLFIIVLCAAFISLEVSGQTIWMHPNRGQWDNRIEYKVELQMGEMLIEKDGFTFFMNNLKHELEHSHGEAEEVHEEYEAHVIQSKFVGANWGGEREENDESSFYKNYILGNDQSKWKSNVYSYSDLKMKKMYPGIDLRLEGKDAELKYSFLVEANGDPSQIKVDYTGANSIFIDEEGNLHLTHRFGDVIEEAPIAWVESEGRKEAVEVRFKLTGSRVVYEFPEGYDTSKPLVIDPNLTFSSFSGATVDNWGFTAAPDANGNLFGGGVVFGAGYPVTLGAYSGTHGGLIDIGISKFSADGSVLLYSTYIGGQGSEAPNSLVAAPNGELYILGVTSSPNFPITGGAFDNTFDGGGGVAQGATNNLDFTGGADIYIARLSANGSSLLSSTYVGGSGTDGVNVSSLVYNYGDQFRSDIVLDDLGNVYVSSTTTSTNFPIVQGTQGALAGGQDAVIFKMPPNLSSLTWSTYFGGSGLESGTSIQVASNGDVYVAGGTTSPTLPIVFGNDVTFNGGVADGYVARFNGTTGANLSGTFMGANEYDQAYFVQLDINDDAYVLGQTESNWAITPGHYGVANSGQYIRKYDPTLTTIDWTTTIGAGSGHVEISPTAFLVSDCYDIYLSGWGGVLNSNGQASNSTTFGFPATADAFQTSTNGSNFWIAVLDQDAMNLKYATYMGGVSSSNNHVDGGTSRFDKSGRIYHAVCGACGGVPNGFTTTPGVWSPLNPSPNCNLAAFKFELSTIEATISDPDPLVCLPDPVIFNNNSSNGNAFFWDFGDGSTSTEVNPTHLYPGPGDYSVTLIVSDTNGCFSSDSTEFIVHIGDFQGGVVTPPSAICPGESYQLEAFGGANYEWTPAQFLDNPSIATPTATLTETTHFQVIISDSCGIDTVNVTVEVFIDNLDISNDTSICIGNDVQLFASGGVSYQWSPATFLDDPTSPTPISVPTESTLYSVEVTTSNNCLLTGEVQVDVYYTPPVPVIPDTVPLCAGSTVQIQVSGAETYNWSPPTNITPLTGPVVDVNPTTDIEYYCLFTNACGDVLDSVYVDVITASIMAESDTIICPGEQATLTGSGGVSYSWSPANSLSNGVSSLVLASPSEPTMYVLTGIDQYGCVDTDSVFVDLYPQPFIQTVPDVYAFMGDVIELGATSSTSGPFVWSPAEFLSCVVCENPVTSPDQNFAYVVSYTDENGCSASDSVHIFYDPILYVPNTFTPGESDNLNALFKAEGGNIDEFRMDIYNRWGELVYTIPSLDEGWDGRYTDGQFCQDGTYTWKATLKDLEGEEHIHVGHINLLR